MKPCVIVLCLLLAACKGESPSSVSGGQAGEKLLPLSTSGMSIDRYHDKDFGVVCYRYWGHGIVCVKVDK